MKYIRQRPETVGEPFFRPYDFSGLIMSERLSERTAERTIEGLRIHIDRDLCVSFGDCIEAAPGVFEFDDEEIAVFVSESGTITRKELIAA